MRRTCWLHCDRPSHATPPAGDWSISALCGRPRTPAPSRAGRTWPRCGSTRSPSPLPQAIHLVAARARAHTAGRSDAAARSVVPVRAGTRLSCQGAALDDAGSVAVTLHPARVDDIAPHRPAAAVAPAGPGPVAGDGMRPRGQQRHDRLPRGDYAVAAGLQPVHMKRPAESAGAAGATRLSRVSRLRPAVVLIRVVTKP
jgi:hypothetical protein